MKETLKRALRTFFQAAVGYLSANAVVFFTAETAVDFDYIKSALTCLLVSSVAAGLAALMNLPKKL